MDDITKSLLDIKEKISSIEIGSVENLKQILENTSEIKKIIDEITKKQWKELMLIWISIKK